MKYGCTNCLFPVETQGTLCHFCRELRNDADDGVDLLWIKSLKERRMKSYARARKAARRGQ
jgi:hypothetical protein